MRINVKDEAIERKMPLISDETPSGMEMVYGLIVGVLYILGISLLPFFILLSIIFKSDVDLLSSVAQVLSGIVSIIVMLLVISKRKLPAIFNYVDRDEYLYGFIGGAVMYGIAIVIELALTTIYGDAINSNANQDALILLSKDAPILFILLVGFVAPIIEELIFRYYLYRPMERKLFNKENKVLSHKQKLRNALIAGLISVILFSGIHFISSIINGTLLEDLKTLPLYIAPSIILIFIYYRTERIVSPIIAHMTYNLITAIIMLSSNVDVSSELTRLVSKLW